jgi:hypothetical protein
MKRVVSDNHTQGDDCKDEFHVATKNKFINT